MGKILQLLAIPFYIRGMRERPYLILLCFLMMYCAQVQAQFVGSVPDAFVSMGEKSHVVLYTSKQGGPKGGHLQGIQVSYRKQGSAHVIITGSSAEKAYYLDAEFLGSDAALSTLDTMPYRHAGGCQLSGDVMAVGVEDNMAKDKAKVVLVNVKDNNAIAVIERKGSFERSTAGAVGYIRLKTDQYLIAVGDWDSKSIDFYKSVPGNVARFDSVATLTPATIQPWGSYQSINLVSDTSGKLYMFGFCKDAKGNRADLFDIQFLGKVTVASHISSKYFKSRKGANFRYAAGLGITAKGQLEIVACSRNLKKGKNYMEYWD